MNQPLDVSQRTGVMHPRLAAQERRNVGLAFAWRSARRTRAKASDLFAEIRAVPHQLRKAPYETPMLRPHSVRFLGSREASVARTTAQAQRGVAWASTATLSAGDQAAAADEARYLLAVVEPVAHQQISTLTSQADIRPLLPQDGGDRVLQRRPLVRQRARRAAGKQRRFAERDAAAADTGKPLDLPDEREVE